jgi:hypothetical protein
MMSVKQFLSLGGAFLKRRATTANRSKSRQVRGLKMESLENREFMAADISANLSGGTLRISGTDNGEFVRVVQVGSNIAVYNGYNTRSPILSPRPVSQVNNIQIQMKGGNDTVELKVAKALDSIFIDMGKGSNERIFGSAQAVRNLTVAATQSLNTSANLSANVTGVANFQFGAGQDTLQLNRSTINDLRVGMGRGNDTMVLHSTAVTKASVNLGEGDDRFRNLWGSQVSQGSIDSGPSEKYGNRWDGLRFLSSVVVRGFKNY